MEKKMESSRELPKVFIGSSSEGLDIAYAVQEELELDANSRVWSQGIFQLSSTILDGLLKTLDTTDFGIFVFSADDVLKIRDQHVQSVRDNVIFELGLFIGRLGKDRSFFIIPRNNEQLHLPTDLLGIIPATFNPDREDIQAAIGPACNKIRKVIREFGKFRKSSNSYNFLVKERETFTPIISTPIQNGDAIKKIIQDQQQKERKTSTPIQNGNVAKKITQIQRQNVTGLQRGQRTPEKAYYLPILQAIDELGGAGRMSDVLKKLEQSMKEVLKPIDYEKHQSGTNIRWRSTAQFARNTMIGKGLLEANSPRGIWEITEAGRTLLKASL